MTARLLDGLPRSVRNFLRYDLPALLELRHGEAELRILPKLLGQRGGIVDVGANVGVYSRLTRLLGRSVIAFEPNPGVADHLRSALQGDGTVHEVCLSDTCGDATFFIPQTVAGADISSRGSLEASANSDRASRSITVPTRRLDDYQLDDIALLKIDVEGHEWPVLLGGAETISRAQPVVLVEVEEHRAPGNLSHITEFMQARGYSGWYLHGRTAQPIAEFDTALLQRADQAPVYGAARSSSTYVNNFLWLPASRLARTVLPAANRSAVAGAAAVAGCAVGRMRRLSSTSRSDRFRSKWGQDS